MQADDDIYRKLQINLDKLLVGFPKADSGADIRVLKACFNPEQAKMALYLGFISLPLNNICAKSQNDGYSKEETESFLESMVQKRKIVFWSHPKTNVKYYAAGTFDSGLFAWNLNRLDTEKAIASGEYFKELIREFMRPSIVGCHKCAQYH